MDTIISTNILFFTLSVFIIFLTFCTAFLFFYTVLIFKNINYFFEIIKRETGKIEIDIDAVREKVKDGGILVASFLVYLMSFFRKSKKSKK